MQHCILVISYRLKQFLRLFTLLYGLFGIFSPKGYELLPIMPQLAQNGCHIWAVADFTAVFCRDW